MQAISDALNEKAWVIDCAAALEPPSLSDNTADVERLGRELSRVLQEPVEIPCSSWGRIPGLLRRSNFRVSARLFRRKGVWRLLDLYSDDSKPPNLSLAMDLGTTTLVCRLTDCDTGEVVGECTVPNPQAEAGADILSRIQSAGGPGGLESLQRRVRDGFNGALDTMCGELGISPSSIGVAAVAGNTTMTHFLLGLDPSNIRKEPYIPVVNRPGWVPAPVHGLGIHPNAELFVFPNVGSYFGGDLIAGILSSGLHKSPDVCFLVDVGTNAEVVLGNSEWLLACAGAAGPALEGGVAKMGMLAGEGAIDHVRIDRETLETRFSVIGGELPSGICGSGLIDLVAELFASDVIDQRGKIRGMDHERILETDEGRAFVIVPGAGTAHGRDVSLSQVDLDILLRSKAAMYTILTTIVEEVGLGFGDVDKFFVAGTFGTYIDPSMAIRIGMIPDLPLERYTPLGNSSLAGAALFLSDRRLMGEVESIAEKVTYLELNVNAHFMGLFSAAKFIPHTDPSLFPSAARS